MNIFKKKQEATLQKKQVLVDPVLYNKVKGKMVARGTTFSKWLKYKMIEEIHENI